MYTVLNPCDMNETFARAFNSRQLEYVLALYEPGSILLPDESNRVLQGKAEIGAALEGLLHIPGTLVSRNNFCAQHGDLALLRADWRLIGPDGNVVVSGSSAEIVRRQADGRWLYVIDHAAGASRPQVGWE